MQINDRFQMNRHFLTERRFLLLLLLFILVLLWVFLPHIGHGFYKDDFNWIDNGAPGGRSDYFHTFSHTTGFFRPIVGLSFGIQYHLWGLNPLPFSVFNLLLHLIIIFMVYILVRVWGGSEGAAFGVSVLFGMNVKSAIMAVGWISGRTTLLFSIFVIFAYLFFKNFEDPKRTLPKRIFYLALANLFFLLALGAKETAAGLLPFLFFSGLFNVDVHNKKLYYRAVHGIKRTLYFFPAMVVYGVLRFSSDAFLPANAPEYYRYTLNITLILKNVAEYITRSLTLPLLVLFCFTLLFLLNRRKKTVSESVPIFDEKFLSGFRLGSIWFLSFIAPTLLLPVRSDLYVYFAQIGLLVPSIQLIGKLWERFSAKRAFRYIGILTIVTVLLLQGAMMFKRLQTIRKEGIAGSHFINEIAAHAKKINSGTHIVVIDRDDTRFSPVNTVSHGFEPYLKLKFPRKQFSGIIVSQQNAGKIKRSKPSEIVFWEQEKLTTSSKVKDSDVKP